MYIRREVCGRVSRGRAKLTWVDDIIKWTNFNNLEKVKRLAEDRDKWRAVIVNLILEDDKRMNRFYCIVLFSGATLRQYDGHIKLCPRP
jgi:hypothetical protein